MAQPKREPKPMEFVHFSERTDLEFLRDDHGLPYLPSEVYSQALSAMVITCVDLIFCHGDQLMLGLRRREPRASWWVIGGRMFPGESPEITARRKARDEANVIISDDQLVPIGVYSTMLGRRSQPPVEEGLHSVNLTYAVMLRDDQIDDIKLHNEEYAEHRWMRRSELPYLIDPKKPMDCALMQVWKDLVYVMD